MGVRARIRLPVLPSPCLYQVFCFVRAFIHALRCSSFSCLDVFMRCIHPCFTSIHASHLITRRTRLYVACAIHKLLIRLTDTCIHAFILSLLQVMYQLHGSAPSLRFCFSLHVSTTRHYVPCPNISSPICWSRQDNSHFSLNWRACEPLYTREIELIWWRVLLSIVWLNDKFFITM